MSKNSVQVHLPFLNGSELESSFTTLKREVAAVTAGTGAGTAEGTAAAGALAADPTLPWIPLGTPTPPEALTAAAAVVVVIELMLTLAADIWLPPAAALLPPVLLITLGGKLPPAPPLLALILIPPLTGTLAELNIFTLLKLLVGGLTTLTVVPDTELCIPGTDPGVTIPADWETILGVAAVAWETFS